MTSKSSNRNPVKQIFITFPHSNVDKSQFRDTLLRFEPDYYKICEEKHKDGTPHLHAVIRFKNKYSKSHILKYFKEQFPDDYKRIDVEPVRSIKKSLLYLSKEDPSPLESGTFEENRNPQRAMLCRFAKDFGYSSPEALLYANKQEKDKLQQMSELVHTAWLDLVINDPNFDPPWEILKIFRRIFDMETYVTKDDMTLILNYLNIKE